MLLSFSRSGALPITKVGERLLVHPTGITKLVDKLEASDLVQREANPDDRRGTLARITPAGRRLGQRASKVLGDIRFGADLPDDELEKLVELLRRLRAAARNDACPRPRPPHSLRGQTRPAGLGLVLVVAGGVTELAQDLRELSGMPAVGAAAA